MKKNLVLKNLFIVTKNLLLVQKSIYSNKCCDKKKTYHEIKKILS